MKKLWSMHDLVKHASDHTGLSPALCKELLEKGWTLVFKAGEHHTWVSPSSQLTVPTVEEVTSRGVKIKDKDNEEIKNFQSIASANSDIRDVMGTNRLHMDINTSIVEINISPQQRADVLNNVRLRSKSQLGR